MLRDGAHPDRLADDLRIAVRLAGVVDEPGDVPADRGVAHVLPIELEAPDVALLQVPISRLRLSRLEIFSPVYSMMRVFLVIGWVAKTPQPWIGERRFSIMSQVRQRAGRPGSSSGTPEFYYDRFTQTFGEADSSKTSRTGYPGRADVHRSVRSVEKTCAGIQSLARSRSSLLALAFGVDAEGIARATRGFINLPRLTRRNAADFNWRGAVAEGHTIEVKGVNGDVTAELSPGTEVEVIAERRGRRSNPEDVKLEVLPHARRGDDLRRLPEPRCVAAQPVPGRAAGGRMNVQNNDVEVRFVVRVPRGVRFAGRTVNGAVDSAGDGRSGCAGHCQRRRDLLDLGLRRGVDGQRLDPRLARSNRLEGAAGVPHRQRQHHARSAGGC